jgi:hypothetical protein
MEDVLLITYALLVLAVVISVVIWHISVYQQFFITQWQVIQLFGRENQDSVLDLAMEFTLTQT